MKIIEIRCVKASQEPWLVTIDDAHNIHGMGVSIQPGESVLDALKRTDYLRHYPEDAELVERECECSPYQYSKRVSRRYSAIAQEDASRGYFLLGPVSPPFAAQVFSDSVRQLSTFVSQLESIFNVIEPDPKTMNAYGHSIRNLLILACTEFEAQCKGVLVANNVSAISNYYNMRDYHKLPSALSLNQYAVTLPQFSKLTDIEPFKNWTPHKLKTGQWQTGLDWYDAYNSVKHDREGSFNQSQLRHAISAVVGCAVILAAQFGMMEGWPDRVLNFFKFVRYPAFPEVLCYQDGVYAPGPFNAKKCPEPPNNISWVHVDYPI